MARYPNLEAHETPDFILFLEDSRDFLRVIKREGYYYVVGNSRGHTNNTSFLLKTEGIELSKLVVWSSLAELLYG